ncbi:MAG: fibronectin type III domain-containing protein [Spirochaetaceae bacterium]|nr:fibronectin type III domain-containing protein [Spirochaetaceae bacterium]
MKKKYLSLCNIFLCSFLALISFISIGCGYSGASYGPPQNLTVEEVFTNAVVLSWSGNSRYSEYVVFVSETDDIAAAKQVVVGENTKVAIGDLAPYTTYYFWVAVQGFSGVSDTSNMVSATTLVDGPTSAKIEFNNTDLIISFNKAQSATGYNIYYNTNSVMDLDKKVSVSPDNLTYKNGLYSYKMTNQASSDGMYFTWVTGTADDSESSNFATAFKRKGIPEYQFYIEEKESGYVTLDTNGTNATLLKINLDAGNISDSKAGKVTSSVEEESLFDCPVFYLNGTKVPRGLIVDENDLVDSSKVIRLEHKPSKENIFKKSNLYMRKSSRGISSRSSSDFETYDVGDTRSFWIDVGTNNSNQTKFERISATLKVEGDYGYIWVANSNYDNDSSSNEDNYLKLSQLQILSDTFDKMFQAETAIFGKTYKEQYDEMWDYGLITPKEKISILIFDIGSDFAENQNSGILGYFWSKDMLPDDYTFTPEFEWLRSNEDEIFYMDVHFLDKFPNLALGTLVHEFQHMLHFVNKTVKFSDGESMSETWYDEMLSLLTEDLFAKELNVDLSEMMDVYIKSFMADYSSKGLTSWYNDNLSYGYSYLMGAFVARNYGDGIEVVREIASNEYFNIESIVEAIQTVTDDSYFTEETLFKDFARALCYPEGMIEENLVNATIWDIRHFGVEKETSIYELDSDYNIDFDIYLEPIIFSDYSFVAKDSSGQIVTILGPYQYPRDDKYNSENVIYGKGIILRELGVYDDTSSFFYIEPTDSNIKEYFVIQ